MPRQIQNGNTIGVPAGVTFPGFGTLGLGVSDNKANPYALTCTHVVADPRNGDVTGVSVQCPASVGKSLPNNDIGTVYSWIPIDGSLNTADAGLVKLNSKVLLSNMLLDLAGQQVAVNYQVADFAIFHGAAITVRTCRGPVAAIAGPVIDQSFDFNNRTYPFTNVLSYCASEGHFVEGDSGAAVVDNQFGQFLGIHLAGSGSDGYCTVAPQIWIAFVSLGLSFSH